MSVEDEIGRLIDQLVVVIAAYLTGTVEGVLDAIVLVSRIPEDQMRKAVLLLAQEVAERTLAPAEDRDEALERVRTYLLEAAMRRG